MKTETNNSITEQTMIQFFGKKLTERIKQSSALICKYDFNNKTYKCGYSNGVFYTVNEFPFKQ